MQRAETLLEIIHERGKRGLPLERLYRHLFNPELYLRAYGKIYRNDGSMTPGVNAETVDGMSLKKIQAIIDALRYERYRWTPVRRVYIDKKGSPGKRRPLGLPTWSDKLLQEVIRSLLEAYYDPQFSDRSHGFRPGRGCHTALAEVSESWRGTTWFVEGDISQCFDRLDHAVLRSLLAEDIRDNRFLRLIDGLLQAGYLEEWRYHETLSGAPQGGVLSPLLSNIYLDRLDKYVEKTLLPVYNLGGQRKPYRPYMRMHKAIWKMERNGRRREARPASATATASLPRPQRSRFPTAALCPLRGRLAVGIHWYATGSRGYQGQGRKVPAASSQAGTVRAQDLDHPRADGSGPLPRLRNRGPPQ
jgi:retron-type reverse transcriptase